MEITIKINGRMVSVEVSDEVAECYDQGRRKAENLSHEKRRHWDDREFDEYMVAAEGLLPYQPPRRTSCVGVKLWPCCCPFWTPAPQFKSDRPPCGDPHPQSSGCGFVRPPCGGKAVLELVAARLLCAVAEPHLYEETAATLVCAGQEFAAKGKTIQRPSWRRLDAAYHAGLKNAPEPEERPEEKTLPELSQGQSLPVSNASVKEGKTSPPKHFTEDTLLSAMENAGKEDMPDTAERKGLGTPATRAGILEKLASTGFLERKKSKKTVQLMPSRDARSLITVLPEQLQSPLLTAEWEYRLGEIERGELSPEEFLSGIYAMLRELAATYQVVKGTEYLFSPPREAVGRCPRCGGEVTESQKGFFCQSETCRFAIWKDSKWWSAKKKQSTKSIVAALLKDGRARLTGCYSEKTGKTYDADVLLEDTGEYVNFKLDFGQRKGGPS